MKKKESLFFFTGLILFCIVLIDIFWWFQISWGHSNSFTKVKQEYLEKFGGFIKNGRQVPIINTLVLATAGFLFYKAKSSTRLKYLSHLLLVACIIIGAWQVFTLF